MRAVVPVERDGDVVALVSVGITVERIDRAAARRPPCLIASRPASVLLVGLAGAWLVSRGCGGRPTAWARPRSPGCTSTTPRCCTPSARACCCSTTRTGCSSSTTRRAGCSTCPTTWSGRSVHDLGLPPGLVAAALGRTAEADDIYLAGDRVLVVSSSPAPPGTAATVGAVVTLRDHTELQAVTGELDVVRGLTESLRSQNHEAANRLHTVVSPHRDGPHRGGRRLRHRGARRSPSCSPTGWSARSATRCSPPCCSARPPRPPSAASSCGRRASCPPTRRPGRATWSPSSATSSTTPSTPWPAGDERRVAVRLDGAGDAVDDHRRRQRARASPRTRPSACSSAAGRPRPAAAAGRGVGLALVAQVARRHGGEVAHRPAPPSAARSSRWRCDPVGRGARPVTVRVLVVEDEATRGRGARGVRRPGRRLRGRRRRALGRRRRPVPRPATGTST